MSDERLRALERRWLETGAEEDELAWDQERERQGLPPRVTVASLSVRIFEPHLHPARVEQEHSGGEDWERLVQAVARRRFAPWLIVDLSDSTYFHDALAGRLVESKFRLQELGGGLVLCGVQSRIMEVFQLLGLGALFSFSDSLTSCLRERGWEQRGPAVPIEHLVRV